MVRVMVRYSLFLLIFAVGLSLAMGRAVLPGLAPAAGHGTLVVEPGSAKTSFVMGLGQELTLTRDGTGQFHVEASVNGQPLPFLIDTGADQVALTIDSARQAGLYIDPTGFGPVAVGASGPVRGTRVTLGRLEVAGRTLERVDALVLEGLGTNLLGQSVLGRLGAVEMRGDTMVLR